MVNILVLLKEKILNIFYKEKCLVVRQLHNASLLRCSYCTFDYFFSEPFIWYVVSVIRRLAFCRGSIRILIFSQSDSRVPSKLLKSNAQVATACLLLCIYSFKWRVLHHHEIWCAKWDAYYLIRFFFKCNLNIKIIYCVLIWTYFFQINA